ncbi:nitronate monooxygenase [Streptomyces sp. NPDC058891]|uniref:nitronate monooxygenase n=1 Tax=unclassified Streptomyces TaxID=2593676 RepID=UPI0036BE0B33
MRWPGPPAPWPAGRRHRSAPPAHVSSACHACTASQTTSAAGTACPRSGPGRAVARTRPPPPERNAAAHPGPPAVHPFTAVSFTFGLPGRSIVAELRRAGTVVVQTVTSADEARGAAGIMVDAVIVQASAAGGHSATFTPAHLPAPLRCRN